MGKVLHPGNIILNYIKLCYVTFLQVEVFTNAPRLHGESCSRLMCPDGTVVSSHI